MPQRIQLRRTKGWRKPDGAVVVARPTKWGNPFKVGGSSPFTAVSVQDAVERFRLHVGVGGLCELGFDDWEYLRGKDLACWCPLEDEQGNRVPCHADVLLELANPGWTP